jgi:hypothetical protein
LKIEVCLKNGASVGMVEWPGETHYKAPVSAIDRSIAWKRWDILEVLSRSLLLEPLPKSKELSSLLLIKATATGIPAAIKAVFGAGHQSSHEKFPYAYFSLIKSDNIACVKLLLGFGVSLGGPESMVAMACEIKSEAMLELLVSAGLNLSAVNAARLPQTSLQRYIEHNGRSGDLAIVKAFIRLGASLMVLDNNNKKEPLLVWCAKDRRMLSPAVAAELWDASRPWTKPCSTEFALMLTDAGILIDWGDSNSWAIRWASSYDGLNCSSLGVAGLERLICSGFDINASKPGAARTIMMEHIHAQVFTSSDTEDEDVYHHSEDAAERLYLLIDIGADLGDLSDWSIDAPGEVLAAANDASRINAGRARRHAAEISKAVPEQPPTDRFRL